MEIGNKPRVLFQTLKQSVLAKSQETTDESAGAVDRMEFADQLTLCVTAPFEATLPERYSVGGIKGRAFSVRPDTLVDNNPETDDSITVKTDSGFYRISERHGHEYQYITSKWNDGRETWVYQRDGFLADS
jgi:hypothetical protein